MKKIINITNIFLFLIIVSLIYHDSPKIEINTKKEVTTDNSKEIVQENVIPKTSENDNEIRVGTVLTGNMTAYGRDCCSSDVEQQGKTSSGYNLRINGKTYHDKQYGELRILASDKYARLNYGIHSNVKFEVLRLGK